MLFIFEYVDKILRCDHSNETSLTVLSHDTILFINTGISLNFKVDKLGCKLGGLVIECYGQFQVFTVSLYPIGGLNLQVAKENPVNILQNDTGRFCRIFYIDHFWQ